jgi:hypothetical protein
VVIMGVAITGQVGAALPPVSRRALWSAPLLPPPPLIRIRTRTPIRRLRPLRIARTRTNRIAGFDHLSTTTLALPEAFR